jgi:DNA primase
MSAWISPKGKSWHCHGCGAGGTVLDLMSIVRGYTIHEAALSLADYAGIPVSPAETAYFTTARIPGSPPSPPPVPDAPPAPASTEVDRSLQESQARLASSDHAITYLTRRGISLSIARAAGIGFAPRRSWPNTRGAGQPRIVAPLTTPDGTLLTLYGRSTVRCEKPLRHDFLPGAKGVFHASSLAHDHVVMIEGVFDALACLAGGLQATALCGVSIRDAWWRAITATHLTIAMDADEAGQAAQHRLEDLARTGFAAGKRITLLKPSALKGHKDLSEYWVHERSLPTTHLEPPPRHAAQESR